MHIAPITAASATARGGHVEIEAVTKSYGAGGKAVAALRPVSLAIEPGSFVTIVGRSGCGKSTLLRLIAGLARPDGGLIRIDGAPVEGPPDGVRYVFQDYGQSLLPWKSARANVAFGLRHAHGGRRAGAGLEAEYLRAVGLEAAADRYPWQMSGGMQQRLAIARALASDPELLLLDEPFSAVDALSRAQLQDMLLGIWQELGVTIVLVTHDIEEAIYLADRVIVLAPGGAGVQADVRIGLPRPRRQVETRESAEYLAHRRELLRLVLE